MTKLAAIKECMKTLVVIKDAGCSLKVDLDKSCPSCRATVVLAAFEDSTSLVYDEQLWDVIQVTAMRHWGEELKRPGNPSPAVTTFSSLEVIDRNIPTIREVGVIIKKVALAQ
jgi:hypothetical protein